MEGILLFVAGVLAFFVPSSLMVRATRKVWLQGTILLVCIVVVTLLRNTLQLPEALEQGVTIGCYMQLIATGADAFTSGDEDQS